MKASLWAWILQRWTALLLFVFVGIHFSIMHFVDPTVHYTFATSSVRLQGLLYFIVDAGMLVCGLYHGLNGVRNIILDLWPNSAKVATWSLSLFGVVATLWGATALRIFLQ